MNGMTREELLALPAVVDVVVAGQALLLGRTKTYQLVQAGEFPVRVLRLGRTYRVVTADLLALLGVTAPPRQSEGAPATDAPTATAIEPTEELPRVHRPPHDSRAAWPRPA